MICGHFDVRGRGRSMSPRWIAVCYAETRRVGIAKELDRWKGLVV